MLFTSLNTSMLTKRLTKVEVIYNNFKSAILQTVLVEQLLPLVPEAPEGDTLFLDYIYEPGQVELFEMLLGKHLNMQMWKVLLDSNAAEQAARMAAMENATQKAKELIDELVLQRNRARQTQITTENFGNRQWRSRTGRLTTSKCQYRQF